MKQRQIVILLLLTLLAWNASARVARDTLHTGKRADFVENRGQWDERVLFRTQMADATLFVERDCFTIAVREHAPKDAHFHHAIGKKMHAYRMHFVGSTQAQITGNGRQETYSNYFIGNDSSRWASNVPHYDEVKYTDIYPGIDLRLYSAEHVLKYDFIVHPGANPSQIVMEYEGTEGLRLRNGDLLVRTSVNEVVEMSPYAYQEAYGKPQEVECAYRIKGNQVRFEVGNYDAEQTLIIDPTLIFSSYTGSTADNWGTTATYDSYKNAYTAGVVFATGYPVHLGAYEPFDPYFHGGTQGICDIGIFKFDATGSQCIFATYLGGSQCDIPHSMYVNSFDELLILGTTGSNNFPTTVGAYDRTFNGGSSLDYLSTSSLGYPNGSDLFVCRFSSDGTRLKASTYIGGSGNDGLNYTSDYNHCIYEGNGALYFNYGDGARGELITDDLNNVYVGSTTFSSNFPVTSGCLQRYSGGGQDGVVFKLDHNLKNLLWSTYLGGSGDDAVYSIDTDEEYNVVVCGGTTSNNFTTTSNAYQRLYGGGSADGFISKISYDGNQLMGSTYFGSTAYDQLYFVRCGKGGDIFVYGQTKASGSTWIYNANYNTPNSGMLLARLSGNLQGRIWTTVFGTADGKPNLSPTAFGVDPCNRVYAVGWGREFMPRMANWYSAGTSHMSITPNAYQDSTDGQDFYIMTLDGAASQLGYATYFGELHPNPENEYDDRHRGADHVDGGTSRFDRLGTLYQSVCASCFRSSAFPTTPGAWYDTNVSNNCVNALFCFNVSNDFPVAEFVRPPVGCAPYTVGFHNTGRGSSFRWDFGDGSTSTETNPFHTFDSAGTYLVRLIADLPGGCTDHDTMTLEVKVLGDTGRHFSQSSCSNNPLQIGINPMLGCSYHWIGGNVSDSTIANPYVTETGQYVVKIAANMGGCIESDTFDINFIQIVDTLIVNPTSCPNLQDGSACVSTSNTVGAVKYYWDGILSTDSCITGLNRGNHRLVVEDDQCRVERLFTIQAAPFPSLEKDVTNVICKECEGSIRVHASNGHGMPYTYLWNDGNTDTLRQHLCEGTYRLTYSDTNGCTYRDSTTINLSHSLDNLNAWADDTMIFAGLSTQLHVTPIAGASYLWSPATSLDNPTSTDPVASPEESTLYSVIVNDNNGCSDTLLVHLSCTRLGCGEEELFVPNVFTPNGDGTNDKLCFRYQYISEFHFSLYNRWGEEVFHTDNVNDCWDGRYKESDCPAGVYMYTCQYRCITGQSNEIKGDITLIR